MGNRPAYADGGPLNLAIPRKILGERRQLPSIRNALQSWKREKAAPNGCPGQNVCRITNKKLPCEPLPDLSPSRHLPVSCHPVGSKLSTRANPHQAPVDCSSRAGIAGKSQLGQGKAGKLLKPETPLISPNPNPPWRIRSALDALFTYSQTCPTSLASKVCHIRKKVWVSLAWPARYRGSARGSCQIQQIPRRSTNSAPSKIS